MTPLGGMEIASLHVCLKTLFSMELCSTVSFGLNAAEIASAGLQEHFACLHGEYGFQNDIVKMKYPKTTI